MKRPLLIRVAIYVLPFLAGVVLGAASREIPMLIDQFLASLQANQSADADQIAEWHLPLRHILGNENFDFEDLYRLRSELASEQDMEYYSTQFDYAACQDREAWGFPFTDLTDYQTQLQPFFEEFKRDLVGDLPDPWDRVTVHFKELVTKNETYRVEYLVFGTRLDGIDVHAYLLTPNQPPANPDGYPAVVLLHPSTYGIEGMVGLNPTELDRTNKAALEYVERGAIVLVPHTIEDSSSRIRVLVGSEMVGEAPYHTLVQRVLSGIDYLFDQDEYPIDRLAVHGLSYGGFLALWTTMLDPRVDVVAMSNSVRDYSEWLYGTPGTIINPNTFVWPLDWCKWDMQNQLRFIVPTPLYIESSLLDRDLISRPTDRERYSETPLDLSSINSITDEIAALYSSLGISEDFKAVTFLDEHVIYIPEAVPWVMDQLTTP
jgi:hypothetical protein